MLLDTHALIWWISSPKQLGKKALLKLNSISEDYPGYISAITIWEIGMLIQKKRLELSMPYEDWIDKILRIPNLEVININWQIAVRSHQLVYPYPDPADRIIMATALENNLPLITKDQHIRSFKHIKTIWD